MVITRYYRSLIESRTLKPPWPMSDQEARRYRAWQRHMRRLRALDKAVMALRMLCVRRYNAELAEINADDKRDAFTFPNGSRVDASRLRELDGASAYTRRSGGPYTASEHFEAERWRRS